MAPRSRVRSGSPPAQRPTSADGSLPLRVCEVAPARSRHHTVATLGSSLPLAVRPPRRPRDVRVLPLSVGEAKGLAVPVTFATWSNKVLSRPRAAPNTPDSGSLHERNGESSTASSTPRTRRHPLRRPVHVPLSGTTRTSNRAARRVFRAEIRLLSRRAATTRHSKMTGTSSPAFTPSPSAMRASPLAAAIPDSTLLPCKPWRSQTYRPPRTWTRTRSR